MWRIRHMCHLTLLVGWKLARAVLACYKVSMPERLLTATEVHTRLACSRTQLHYLTRDGKFPQPVKIGRSIRWRESDVDAWIAALAADQAGEDAAHGPASADGAQPA